MIKLLYYTCFLLLLCLPIKSFAFPERPLTLLVGFNPGGSMDRQAQVLAHFLERELNQPVEIIYFPGSGGGAAAAMLAASQEEGYVIQLAPSLSFTFPPLTTSASYNLQSFRFLAALARDQLALVASNEAGFSTWQGLLESGQQTGELIYASQTQLDRFLVTHLAAEEGLSLRTLPTTGGSSTLPLVLAGETDFAFSGGSYIQPALEGRLQVLLALGSEPLKHFPEVPTLKDAGYDLKLEVIRLLAVPANTPEEHAQVLIEVFSKLAEDEGFREATLEAVGLSVIFKQGEALNAFMQEQQATLEFLVNESRP